ncbi:hypothetical protein [Hanstruepera ponticola]|uniref:hypothetical protein n=1 Tax=Hanstruepera ponticola TaxID=2042995 RepID=UPI001780AC34|nr:hypothetical protein [Hanstruepera ponticola]
MAKQQGIIPLVGTLGGINFYYLNGKPVARKAGGGFNGKAIKSHASMQRVRENSSEFGHCSAVNKAFRTALRPFYNNYKFTFFHSRLMGLFTQLKDLDTINKRGERCVGNGVAQSNGLALFKRFDYTPDCDVRGVLPFKYTVDASTFELTISEFDITRVGFISGATHIGLTYGVLDMDFDTLDYDLHLADSLILDLDFMGTTVSLVPNSMPVSSGTFLAVLGVRFYQEVDGVLYVLNAKDGVGIRVLECFLGF